MHELKVEFGETSKQLQALKEDLQILQEGRDSLSAQLELVLAKTESEELARSIAEEHLPDLEKEKTMLELEIKDINSRYKTILRDRDLQIIQVLHSLLRWSFLMDCVDKQLSLIDFNLRHAS